jgi:hypothetical protein
LSWTASTARRVKSPANSSGRSVCRRLSKDRGSCLCNALATTGPRSRPAGRRRASVSGALYDPTPSVGRRAPGNSRPRKSSSGGGKNAITRTIKPPLAMLLRDRIRVIGQFIQETLEKSHPCTHLPLPQFRADRPPDESAGCMIAAAALNTSAL